MGYLTFGRSRLRQLAMLGSLSILAAFGGWSCAAAGEATPITAVSGTEFAYVANSADNTVSAYAVDSSAGTLKPIGTTSVGKSPTRIVSVSLGTNKNYVYVLNQKDSSISQFAVDATGMLAPLNPAIVSVGNAPTDMALSADGTAYQFYSFNGSLSTDTREFRVYVTTQTGGLNVYGVSADGQLTLKNQLQGLGYPVAVSTTGPDYVVYANDMHFGSHDLDSGVAVLDQSSNLIRLYSLVPLAKGGLKPAATPTLSAQAPLSVAGTTTSLYVGLVKDQVNSYSQSLTDMLVGSPGAYNKTVQDVGSSPVSITSLALYAHALETTPTTLTYEYTYAATADGAIYRIGDSTPELQFNPTQPLFLKGYRGRLYVVKYNDNTVVSYAPHFGSVLGSVQLDKQNGTLQADSAQSAATGHAPTSITFLNTTLNGGAVQTTIR